MFICENKENKKAFLLKIIDLMLLMTQYLVTRATDRHQFFSEKVSEFSEDHDSGTERLKIIGNDR